MLWWTLRQLKSKDSATRNHIAEELGKSKERRAVKALIAALKWRVRMKAASALRSSGWEPKDDNQSVLQAIAILDWNTVVRFGAAAVEPLVAMLTDDNKDVRINAARSLGEIRDARAVEPLVNALKDSDQLMRCRAAEALGKIGDIRAVESLVAALGDYNYWRTGESVQKNAVKALGEISDASAVGPLIAVLDGHNSEEVVEALVKIGNAAVEPLIAALRNNDSSVRRNAAITLGKIGDTQAATPLVDALGVNRFDSVITEEIIEASVKMGDAAIAPPTKLGENSIVRT